MRLDDPRHRLLLALLEVLDLDQATGLNRVAEGTDEVFLRSRDVRLGRLGEFELAERLLQLAADTRERRVGVGGDHRPDELQREPDRARLERGQPRRGAERVAEELLVDVDVVAAQLRIDRVAATAEVDEVEQGQMLLERLRREPEALGELPRRDLGLVALAAGVEQVREERL